MDTQKKFTWLRDRAVWRVLIAILGLNLVAWGWFGVAATRLPILVSLGVIAYLFGLRHAVDADHIAAIDNTTRKLMNDGKETVSVGFYFSLGHSTIVILLTAFTAFAVRTVQAHLPTWQHLGSLVGTGVSALFLYLIALLNLGVLRGILDLRRKLRKNPTGNWTEAELDAWLAKRGLLSRFYQKLFRLVSASWQMYFIGFLFGLGFDTASEMALFAIAASASSQHMPIFQIMVLPILFTAGMSLIDTADGVFMRSAYSWAFANQMRKVSYNLVITTMSILIAFVIGTIEWMQVVGMQLGVRGGFWIWIGNLDFGTIGLAVIVVLILSWLTAGWIHHVHISLGASGKELD